MTPGDLESALSRLKAEIWTEERSEVGCWCSLRYWRPLSTRAGRSALLGQGDGQQSLLGGLCTLCSGVMPPHIFWRCLLLGQQLQGACLFRTLAATFEQVAVRSAPVSQNPLALNAGIWRVAGPARYCLGQCTAPAQHSATWLQLTLIREAAKVLLQVAQALAGLRVAMTADAEAVHANFVQQLMAGRRDAAAAIAQEHSELAAELQALGQQLNAALAGQQAKLTALVHSEVQQVGCAGPFACRAAPGSCSGLHWVLARVAREGQPTKPTCSWTASLSSAGPPSLQPLPVELLSSSSAPRLHSAASQGVLPSSTADECAAGGVVQACLQKSLHRAVILWDYNVCLQGLIVPGGNSKLSCLEAGREVQQVGSCRPASVQACSGLSVCGAALSGFKC